MSKFLDVILGWALIFMVTGIFFPVTWAFSIILLVLWVALLPFHIAISLFDILTR